MYSFKFDQIEAASIDFKNQKQITNLLKINVNKVAVSGKISCNNGKDWERIVGYQVDEETIVPKLFIKTTKNIFSYGVSQYDKHSAYTVPFKVSKAPKWMLQYRNIWNEV